MPRMGTSDAGSGLLGHSSQPAAVSSFEARKQNLDPKRKKELMKPPKSRSESPAISTLPTFKLRQMEREERSKQRYRMPDAASKISAEKLISKNPLLDDSLVQGSSFTEYKVRSLSSLSLTDLCMLHIAFDKADEDKSGELDTDEFVAAFLPLLATDAGDVSLLFMRIDANCDGTVSWEEFLTYILSQDEGALQIETESSRQMFDFPIFTDTASQVNGHRDTAAGLLVLAEADRYVSFSRKGDMLVWKPDGIEGIKVQHPREFMTDLPFITGLVHAKRLTHSDRLALCSADKQLMFVDVMRDSCKLAGTIKLDASPLCMCTVVIRDDHQEEKERMLGFGDDSGTIHMYNLQVLGVAAERNLMSVNSRKAQEGHIRSWQAHDKNAWLSKIEYIDDLRVLVSCASDGQLVLSDVSKGEVKVDGLRHRGEVHDFVWLPRVQLLASCGVERHINLWQLPIKTPVYQLDAHQASVQQLVFGAGQLFSLDTSKTMIVWDLREMAPIQRLEALKVHQEYPIGRMAYEPKRSALLTLSRKMLLWHMNQKKVPNGHTAPVTSCVYNPTFELVVSADDTSVVRVWDLNSGKAIFRFTHAHTNLKGEGVKISSMAFDKSSRRLVTGAHDGTIKLWNFSTGQCLRDLTGFGEGEVTAVCHMHVTPYDYIVACGWNRKVSFWMDLHDHGGRYGPDSKTEVCQHFEGHKDDILCIASHPGTNTLVTGSYDGDIIMWSTESGHMRSRLILPGILAMKGDERPVEAVALLDCGTRTVLTAGRQVKEAIVLVVTVGGDGIVRMWSADASAELLLEMPLAGQDVGLVVLAACSDTKVMIIGDAQGYMYVMDIQSMMLSSIKAVYPTSHPLRLPVQVAHFRAHTMSVSNVQYIRQRRVILTGSQDCTLCLWTLLGEKIGTFGEPKDWIFTRQMNRFDEKLHEPAFGKAFVDSMRKGHDDEHAGHDNGKSSKKVSQRSKGNKNKSVRSHRLSSVSGLPASNIRSGAAEAAPANDDKAALDASEAGGGSFFLTQGDEVEPTQLKQQQKSQGAQQQGKQAASMSVDEFVAAAEEEGSVENSDYDEWDEGRDQEVDERLIEMTDEEKRVLMLKVDIDEIVQRGVAMKERGEKFFESGNREISAYQKMIVRELDSYSLPENIAKRMFRAANVRKPAGEKKAAAPGAASTDDALPGDEDESELSLEVDVQ